MPGWGASTDPRTRLELMNHSLPIVLAAVIIVPGLGRAGTAPKVAQPNVILELADDFGWGDLGGPGGMPAEVPHLDRIAKEGVQFTQFYVAAPICGWAKSTA